MNSPSQVSFLAQTDTGQILHDGVIESEHVVIALNAELGLVALATGPTQTSRSTMKSIEILEDDMMTNLPVSTASLCLTESLDNIHGYLKETSEMVSKETGISMITMQIVNDRVSVASAGNFHCFCQHKGGYSSLLDGTEQAGALGISQTFRSEPVEHFLAKGDLIVLVADADLQRIGPNFMRLTLSRFTDNPEMALRQINTRLSRQEDEQKPALIFVHVESLPEAKGGWLNRWIKR